MNDLGKYSQLSMQNLHESAAMKAAREMARSFTLQESAAMKAARETAQSISLQESAVMKAAREMTQSIALQESAAMKAAREMTQSIALQESASMKAAREMTQSIALQESASMKAAREMARSFTLQESAAIKAAREMTQSIALQESASMRAAREMAQSFSLQESAAMKAVRKMAQSFVLQDSAVITTEYINNLLNEETEVINGSDTVEINNDVIEQVVVGLVESSSSSDDNHFLSWYDNQPASMQLIIGLFLSYWLNVFSSLSMPLYDDWTYLFEREETRVATKLVVQAADKEYEINELESYRFIVASVLHVRNEPTINSEIVDELKNGKVVKYITKSKRWVQVEFLCEETGEQKIGWVFSRYLRKFVL